MSTTFGLKLSRKRITASRIASETWHFRQFFIPNFKKVFEYFLSSLPGSLFSYISAFLYNKEGYCYGFSLIFYSGNKTLL